MGVRLPAEYQEAEYLESDKNSYIDTGIVFTEANYSVFADVMIMAVQDANLFGMRKSSASDHSSFVLGAKNAYPSVGTNWQVLNNSVSWIYSTGNDVFQKQRYKINYQYGADGLLLKVNDIDKISSSFTPRWNDFTDLPLYLFVQNSGYRDIRADECYKMRCYGFVVYRNGEMILDLFPCYRKSDGVPGMYDIISETFLTNQGSGVFTVGPDVIDSISPWMVARRRELMMRKPAPTEYVTDGLVLWLDGINKGNTPDAWTDLVNGVVFNAINGVVFDSDSLLFDGLRRQYLRSTYNTPNSSDATIEVVCDVQSVTDYSVVFSNKSLNGCAFGFTTTGHIIYTRGPDNNRPYALTSEFNGSFSFSYDRQMRNAIQLPTQSFDNWAQSTTYTTVGSRGERNYITGRVYCIRIYDRKLTKAEVLANYAVDRNRFSLFN